MSIDINPLDRNLIKRRSTEGKIWDIIDYPFQVSNGTTSCAVDVGITGVFHDPATALGSTKLSQDELVEAASAWLRSGIEKGELDPFDERQTRCTIEVPSSIMDYWSEYREIPRYV